MTDKEKLIDRLRELASLTPPICQYDRPFELDVMGEQITVYCKPFEQFQNLLREAADALVNNVTREWIPVTERLPEGGELVLAGDYRDRWVGRARFLPDGSWYVRTGFLDNDEITHWMPLPEPPKEGE